VIRAARRLPENPYNRGGDAPGVIGEWFDPSYYLPKIHIYSP
jgi:hypothetical protein